MSNREAFVTSYNHFDSRPCLKEAIARGEV